MKGIFKILGSGAGTGVPSFFCQCPGCREAVNQPELARTRSGACIDTGKSMVLIDASPDLRNQLLRAKVSHIDTVFLTHWHADHYSGLAELEYYVRLGTGSPLPLYLPPTAMGQFKTTYPDLVDIFTLIPWQFGTAYRFHNITLTPLEATHGIETAGILVESDSSYRLAYFPDTAELPASTALRVKGVDCLICDATFFGENWYPDRHLSVEQAVQMGIRLEAKKIILTHLSIHYSQPITTRELDQEVSAYSNVAIARDGQIIEL
jgi:phosphoribosyl 1,2-cyclic phosphate phosphodiesterase